MYDKELRQVVITPEMQRRRDEAQAILKLGHSIATIGQFMPEPSMGDPIPQLEDTFTFSATQLLVFARKLREV